MRTLRLKKEGFPLSESIKSARNWTFLSGGESDAVAY
jgi:hypothetical protein